ncbi:MAG: hypothetical protein L0H79_09940 [Intrasporangium sp.]|uniref:MmyB family transcriptional regulator n=1 Tax=Intrasporangium sp. TaxID=1925024 RepID=UPI0026488C6B|nr:hypothetical protein [Intrasporangium sp.]MDN5796055.1 hypothetical protein [Intrasporangium sp.]
MRSTSPGQRTVPVDERRRRERRPRRPARAGSQHPTLGPGAHREGELGPLTLDCDTLHVPEADQRVIVYSAAPGTPEAEALALLRVLGTQQLSRLR